MAQRPKFRLRTLGATYVAREDGLPLGGAAGQRRVLALLSLLAVAGDGGLSRDRILSLLWPDGDPDRSRHALTQSLYHVRRMLRCDDLFVADGDVRMNFERLSSDVRELDLALRAGELERAAELFAGPFLDGFVLSGSAEFEQWASATRTQLMHRMIAAFEELASAADGRGAQDAAIAWRRRGFALDPFSSTSALRLVTTMMAGGDRSGALQQARIHEQLVREELQLEPDRALQELVERLRLDDANVATPNEGPATPATTMSPPVSLAADRPVGPEAKRRPMPAWVRRSAIAAGLVLSGFLIAMGVMRPPLAATVPGAQHALLVTPFRVTGADAALGYLREGLVELLSLRLAEDSTAHAMDPGVVLSVWHAARLAEGGPAVTRSQAIAVGRRLGAAQLVTGSVVGTTSRVVLSASLLDVARDSIRAQAAVEGPSDSLTTLVDRLASKLIAVSAGEGGRFSDHTTPSPSALRAYLDGQRAYRRGDYSGALPLYELALQRDSGFALAALHLALAADEINDAEQHDRALTLAWANRRDLVDRDLVHLIAFAGPRYPAPSPEAEQLAAWERAVALAPDRAEVWHELGERFFHHGALLGLRDSHLRAAVAFRRALELDPTYLPSRRLLVLLAARSGDTTLLDRWASPAALRDSLGDLAPALRWRVALARRDQQELHRLRELLGGLDDANLRIIGMTSQFDGDGVEDGERSVRIRSRRTSGADRVDALLAAHSLALNQGRPILALDLTEQLEELKPGVRAHLRLRVLDALYGDGDRTAGRDAAERLAQYAAGHAAAASDARAVQLADLCVLEQWRLAHGLTSNTRRVAAVLRAAPIPRTPVPVSASQHACAAILEAWWAVETRQRDALARVRDLDSLMLGGPAVSDAGTYAHIVVERLYLRLGQPARALEAIRNRTYMIGWPRYLATARRDEGRLALALGDRAGAARVYQKYLALRSAEPTSATADAQIRAALRRLLEARTN